MMEVERRREKTGPLIIPALRRLRQEDLNFEIGLSCILRCCLRKQETKIKNQNQKKTNPPKKQNKTSPDIM